MIVLRQSAIPDGRDYARSGGLGSSEALVEPLLPLSAVDITLASEDFHGCVNSVSMGVINQ